MTTRVVGTKKDGKQMTFNKPTSSVVHQQFLAVLQDAPGEWLNAKMILQRAGKRPSYSNNQLNLMVGLGMIEKRELIEGSRRVVQYRAPGSPSRPSSTVAPVALQALQDHALPMDRLVYRVRFGSKDVSRLAEAARLNGMTVPVFVQYCVLTHELYTGVKLAK